jgi:hypothetical protein
MRGKVAACTAEAWATGLPKASLRAIVAPIAPSAGDAIDAALGIRTRAR